MTLCAGHFHTHGIPPMKNMIETWEITLPDGTHIIDEIEYGYALSVTGVSLGHLRNRRMVTFPDGEFEVVAVPENFLENRRDLEQMVSEWSRAERIFEAQATKREEIYVLYKKWLEEHLQGNTLSSLLFSSVGRMPS